MINYLPILHSLQKRFSRFSRITTTAPTALALDEGHFFLTPFPYLSYFLGPAGSSPNFIFFFHFSLLFQGSRVQPQLFLFLFSYSFFFLFFMACGSILSYFT
jgi:hypothetical protein